MRIVFIACLLMLSYGANAVERKPVRDVDTNDLTTELQKMLAHADSVDVIWWIPVEFWEATFRQSPDVPEAQVEQLIGVLKNYSVLAVVQADLSPFGAFSFMEKDAIMDGMLVQVVDADGTEKVVSHTEPSDPDLRIMLDQMRPVLAQAMGNMGENFFFFPMPALDSEGMRLPSPYESGMLRITLDRDGVDTVFEIDMPVDALFVPRVCPNGKPAHVSWTHCPWGGKKLPR